MDPVSLGILAINGLRLVLANPAIGGGSSVRLGQASELLGYLGVLLAEGDDALDDLKAFVLQIEAMVTEGRGPSIAEWTSMRERSDAAHNTLQGIKEDLLGQEETTTPEPTSAPEENEEEDPPAAAPGEGVPVPE